MIGVEAIEKAFGPEGGGIQEIERNAAAYNLLELLRNQTINAD